MKCQNCGKEMDNLKGDYSIKGLEVNISLEGNQRTPENIEYTKGQLGKYADGDGGCHVGICFECYIDRLLMSPLRVN